LYINDAKQKDDNDIWLLWFEGMSMATCDIGCVSCFVGLLLLLLLLLYDARQLAEEILNWNNRHETITSHSFLI
jgi:hypothetical protein